MSGAKALVTLLTAAERNKLVNILGRLGSNHDGERAAAGLLAARLLAGKGLGWNDLIPPSGTGRANPPPRPEPPSAAGQGTAWRENLALCRRHLDELDGWPAEFVLSISRRVRTPTKRQADKLAEIAGELRARCFV